MELHKTNPITAGRWCQPGFILWVHACFHAKLLNYFQTFCAFLNWRGDRCGDLRHSVCIGDNGQIHLQQERDVSEPRSKSIEVWRWPWVPLQQPGGLPERRQWKPKGVFHLAGAVTFNWPGRICQVLSVLLDTTEFISHWYQWTDKMWQIFLLFCLWIM